METGVCRTAHIRHVVLPLEVTNTNSNRRSHAIVHHERELRNGQHDLMGCQSDSPQPAHHDGAQAERGCLHPHLQPDGPAQRIESAKHLPRPSQMPEPQSVLQEPAATGKD